MGCPCSELASGMGAHAQAGELRAVSCTSICGIISVGRRLQAACGSELTFFWKGESIDISRTNALAPDSLDCVLALLTPQNALACRISLATGLRISDVLQLRTEQLRQTSCTVMESKTGKRRRIQLGEALRLAVLSYSGKVWAFPGRCSEVKHRTRQAVYKDIRRAAQALRIPGVVAPHSMRKSFAVKKYHACGDLRRVQKLLQHSNEAVTLLYALATETAAPSVGVPRQQRVPDAR